MLTTQNIRGIFKQIAIDFPYHERRRINTFGVTDKKSDLNDSNLNLNKYDADFGSYWVRGGVQFNKDNKRYALLLLEMKSGTFPDFLYDQTYCVEVWVSVVDLVDCTNCTHKRPIAQIDDDNEEMLRAVIQELKSYSYYKFDLNGTPTEGWFSQARMTAMIDAGDATNVEYDVDSIMNKIRGEALEVYTSGRGIEDFRMKTCMITFCGCSSSDITFNTDDLTEIADGVINNCETCP